MTNIVEFNHKFYERMGFNNEGIGWIVCGNSYEVKDRIKSLGGRFNSAYRLWVLPIESDEFVLYQVSVNELYHKNASGRFEGCYNYILTLEGEEFNEFMEKIENINRELLGHGNHVGEVGNKIHIFVESFDCIGEYSYHPWASPTRIYRVVDMNGDVFICKTTKEFPSEDYEFGIVGTVKAHSEFRFEKQTELSRIKFV